MGEGKERKNGGLERLVKVGLIRELYRRRHITQAQFEQLMKLHRA